MKIAPAALMLVALVPLVACHRSASDRLADRVQNAADQRADALKAQADKLQAHADALNNRADQVRDTGKSRADAIEAADMNVAAMSKDQRNAIVANDAAAVR